MFTVYFGENFEKAVKLLRNKPIKRVFNGTVVLEGVNIKNHSFIYQNKPPKKILELSTIIRCELTVELFKDSLKKEAFEQFENDVAKRKLFNKIYHLSDTVKDIVFSDRRCLKIDVVVKPKNLNKLLSTINRIYKISEVYKIAEAIM